MPDLPHRLLPRQPPQRSYVASVPLAEQAPPQQPQQPAPLGALQPTNQAPHMPAQGQSRGTVLLTRAPLGRLRQQQGHRLGAQGWCRRVVRARGGAQGQGVRLQSLRQLCACQGRQQVCARHVAWQQELYARLDRQQQQQLCARLMAQRQEGTHAAVWRRMRTPAQYVPGCAWRGGTRERAVGCRRAGGTLGCSRGCVQLPHGALPPRCFRLKRAPKRGGRCFWDGTRQQRRRQQQRQQVRQRLRNGTLPLGARTLACRREA